MEEAGFILFVTECFGCGKSFKYRSNLPDEALLICPWCDTEHQYIKVSDVDKRCIRDERHGT